MAKIGIIGAMDVEVRFLKDAMTKISVKTRAGVEFFEGELRGQDVVLARCGIGKVNAALCAQALIDAFDIARVINTGIAGAISDKMRSCDIVFSSDAVYHDFDVTGFGYAPMAIPGMDSVFQADARMLETAARAGAGLSLSSALHTGRIATGDVFVASRQKKRDIQALCDPLCVEMEGAAIAHVCRANKTPFVIIRCISDMADDSGHKTYAFNEQAAAETSARLVTKMLEIGFEA
jgi:adenosylhomocysteine nucleosidase